MHEPTQLMCLPGQETFELTRVENVATSGNTYPQEWFFEWATGGKSSDAGVTINGYTALSHCPLWQGVNIIAGDIGQVPIRLVRDEFNEQRRHPSWNLLRVKPNPLQTPSVWKETMMQWAIIWGNGVSWVVRDNMGRPMELIPLRPDMLYPDVVDFEGARIIIYRYWSLNTGKEYIFRNDDVIHIQGLTSDGIWGYPLHEVARNCIGQGLAIEKHGNATFRNAARLSGLLKTGKRLNEEAMKRLRSSFEHIHAGVDNAGRVAILEEGMEFVPISMSNLDAQWAEAKEMSGLDAARLLNLPAYKLNYLKDSSVRANLEEQNADYVQRTLSRWFNRCSEEFRRKLLTVREWMSDEYEFVWDVEKFLKADIDTMATVIDKMVKAEIFNRNEGRRWFRMPPYEGGEKFGSPAINPQPRPGENGSEEPESDDSDEESGDDDGDTAENLAAHTITVNVHNDLLLDRMTHLVERERDNLRKQARQGRNFVSWLDSFYGGNGEPGKLLGLYDSIVGKSAAAAVTVGIPAQKARENVAVYAKSRYNVLLEACSYVTMDDLAVAIETFLGGDPTTVATELMGTLLSEPLEEEV